MTSNSILSLFQFVSLPESELSEGRRPAIYTAQHHSATITTSTRRHKLHVQLRHSVECLNSCHLQSEKRSKLSARARAKDLFDDLDKDGDGELTMGEFVEGYLQMMVQT